MGTVYKAESVALGRSVAVKLLHGHLTDDAVTVARFQREARAAASVGHENIIEIFDMGVEPSGAPYLVMELIEGHSLARTLREGGALELGRAVRIASQVLSALDATHAHGIIHRDLKPDNVLLTARLSEPDYVKLFDFGVAAFTDAAQDPSGPLDLTPDGRAMGTPSHASPEQMSGARVRDARIDVYAVGVLLFEMLTGRVPFEDKSLPALLTAIATRPPPTLSSRGVEAPAGLEALITRALAKSPDDRFASAYEMAEALVEFGGHPPPPRAAPLQDALGLELRAIRARELLEGAPPAVAPRSPAVVRADATMALLEFIREAIPASRYHALLASSPELAALDAGGISEDAWVSQGLLRVVEQIGREDGDDERRLVAEAGRHLARHAFRGRERDLLLRTLTPELFFSLLPELWGRYFQRGQASVVRVSRGHGRFELRELTDPFLALSVAVTGYLAEALVMAGARDVDVQLAEAVALGDDIDAFEATWVA